MLAAKVPLAPSLAVLPLRAAHIVTARRAPLCVSRYFSSRQAPAASILGLHEAWRTATHIRPAPRRRLHTSGGQRYKDQQRTKDEQGQHKDQTKDEDLGFSARLKKMMKEYGWTALGVYLGLSVLDFPFCFALVRAVGTDRIGGLLFFIATMFATIP